VRGGALLALALASCGNDEAVGDRSDSAGKSGSSSGGHGSSGDGQLAAGEGGTPLAMAGSSPVGGSSSGTSSGRGGTGDTPGGEGGSAGEPPVGPVMEQLTLCQRLSMVTQASTTLSKAFEKLVYADCRVNWLNHLYLDFMPNKRDDYLNALIPWNLQLWGCPGATPVGDFPLVFGKPPLSQGDADIVIGYYVDAAIAAFSLTQEEQDDMRTALEHLATTVIVDESAEPSQPSCEEPGAGGSGTAGVGGMP
jgi:hypothetical protein